MPSQEVVNLLFNKLLVSTINLSLISTKGILFIVDSIEPITRESCRDEHDASRTEMEPYISTGLHSVLYIVTHISLIE